MKRSESYNVRIILSSRMLPKNVHFFTDNIVRKVSSGQICPRFLRTCMSSYIIGILSKKRGPFPFFFYRTLVTPPPTGRFLLRNGKKFELRGDRTRYSYLNPISGTHR